MTAVMDESLYYLMLAQEALDEYIEIDTYAAIFEAESPNVKEQDAKNEAVANKTTSYLQKAIDAIISLGKSIIKAISNFLANLTMSSEERKEYEDFKKACKEDPSLKNKKVTVTDFRKMREEYEKLKIEVKEAEKALAAEKDFPLESLLNKIKGFASNAGKGVAVSVTAEAAVRLASSSKEMAQLLKSYVTSDTELMEGMKKTLGKHQTNKFKREINSLGKRISLKRAMMKLNGELATSLEGAVKDTFSKKGIFSILTRASGNKEVRTAVGTVGADTIVGAVKGGKMAYDNTRAEKKALKYADKVIKNQTSGDFSDQSALDSITGANDPEKMAKRQLKAQDKLAKQQEKEAEKARKDQEKRDKIEARLREREAKKAAKASK